MRVLHLANDYLNTPLYSLLADALEAGGVSNTVFVPVSKQRHARIQMRETETGRRIWIVPCFSTAQRLLYYPKQKHIIREAQACGDFSKIRCIHAHTLFSAGYAAMNLSAKYNVPYIVAVRNTDVNVFFRKFPHLRPEGVRILQNAALVVFLSGAYRRMVTGQYVPEQCRLAIQKKSVVIPNGISDLFLEQKGSVKQPDGHKIRLIYAGEINQNKNLEETLRAAKILTRAGYRISVTVVGNLTDKRCAGLLKDPLVRHFPACGQQELIRHYREADIFVMPSHTETFGLVYAEAMSQGLPVLYTKGQGFDGCFPDGTAGYAVSDRDAMDLAVKIRQVMGNYSRISANCINLADRFDWNRIGREYAHWYEKAAENRTKSMGETKR